MQYSKNICKGGGRMIVIAKYTDGDVSVIHEVERVHIKNNIIKVDFKKTYFQEFNMDELLEIEIMDQKGETKIERLFKPSNRHI